MPKPVCAPECVALARACVPEFSLLPSSLTLRPPMLAAALALSSLAHAQTAPSERIERVTVTANPLRQRDALDPVSSLSGDALTLQRGASLGDTLAELPGVSSTYFGPNANRPTLRGLDGDRVRLLSNSGASVDASGLSFDHAVPIDPLVVERIEVLRGPAALLYGGSALGGVVNALDNRIPRAAQPGLGGVAELRLGGAARERGGAMVLDGGDARWAWHVDGAKRSAEDTRAPAFIGPDGASDRVRNSAAQSHSGAVGASMLFGDGYAGLSVDDYRSRYGVTAEPDVQIQMQRQRLAAAGEWRSTQSLLHRLSWQGSSSRYEHQEVAGDGTVGTTFRSRGQEGRLEATLRPVTLADGQLQSLVGTQLEQMRFSALGTEAFVPSTDTRTGAVFMLEQWGRRALSLSAGLRLEQVRVGSDGSADARFGPPQSRRFSPSSQSLKAGWQLGGGWATGLSLQVSQRAPTFYELYANGLHVATASFEQGNPGLGLERARSLDWSLKWHHAGGDWRLGVYATRIEQFVSLSATGAQVGDGKGGSVPVYAYRPVPAALHGFELEGREHFALGRGRQLTWHGQVDSVQGRQQDNGEPLPRLAPLRVGSGLDLSDGPWHVAFNLRWTARQDRVPLLDTPTPGHTLADLKLSRQWRLAGYDLFWYLKLDNLGNRLAYNAGTPATLRALSPLPGRSVFSGLQLRM